mmetsp:Transcript_52552/g.125521  ORF Transcript_52552/g.125521 Transcript_52552/m.125521 type:complete len:214 (-) Transcript_52552:123-764(-)|eukprot:CAMPEP_0178430712 /NCGR_PEP_ID=MMETSP0689_2-20121128/31463_1 /TAXON_ID=160604 /ORGANISM="Amphidinium massartii, Strain CS-259" /LENGTH=213 /DNA_ID=CAMNT_0020052581 /DNA_START=81 /DNA_END=722 /DNA_ORIENTATION=-
MRRLFGGAPKEAAPAPSLQEASSKIDLQVQSLEEKIAKCEEEIRQYATKNTPSAKTRAVQVMKRKKQYESQRDQLLGTQFNVESLAFAQEQADVTLSAVEAMKAGQQQLKHKTDAIGAKDVDKLMDDMAELNDQMKEINEVLAQSTGMGMEDDGELEEEFAALQAQMVQEAMLPDAKKSPAVAAPAEASTAAASTVPSEPSAIPAGAAAASAP